MKRRIKVVGLLLLLLSIWVACDSEPDYLSVAVLPFLNASGDPDQSRHLVEGFGQHLTSKLSTLPDLKVTRWVTSRRFGDAAIPAQAIGKELEVEALVTGSIRLESGQLQVSVSLVDATSGDRVRTQEIDEPVDDLFSLQSELTRTVVRWLKGNISDDEDKLLAHPPSQSVPAWDFYLRGSQAMQASDEASLQIAKTRFHKALELDPDLAEAWLGLGAVHNRLWFTGWGGEDSLDQAQVYFRRALQLNPALTSARSGLIHVYWYQGRCEEIIREGKKAMEASRDVSSIMVLANAYFYAGLPDAALPLFEAVLSLEPNHQYAHYQRIPANLWIGNYEEVIDAGRRYMETYASEGDIHYYLSQASMSLGRVEEALHHASESVRFPWSGLSYWDSAALIYREVGRFDEVERLVDEGLNAAVHMHEENASTPVLQARFMALSGDREGIVKAEKRLQTMASGNASLKAQLAWAWFVIGDASRGFALLEESQKMGCPVMYEVNQFGFLYDNLRDTPEYKKLFDEDRRAANSLRSIAGLAVIQDN